MRVRARVVSGFEYEATAGGQTSAREPIWPKVIGGTVVDGSVTWTCVALSTDSLIATVSGAAWSAGAAITITSPVLYGQVATAMLEVAEDDTDGTDQQVTVTATLSDGGVIPAVIFLPVRLPVACPC
jgi:hypothetical protein